ncbi:mitotic spindle assembly checkpoint protein MAD1-like [Tubulanus polymorphus]|uniref:mitotic spindle assembly checkpoint protein MAD1-like n=1 Tax=Tubulanus polymorphus TaxID=672921 RepID=UPI003DA23E39
MNTSDDDNTVVLSMMQGYNEFLTNAAAGPRSRHSSRLDFSQRSSFGGINETGKASMKSLIEKQKDERKKEVDLISAKSKITQLEASISSEKMQSKRARIEYEQDFNQLKSDYQKSITAQTNLEQQIRILTHKEQQAKEEISECRKNLNTMKSAHDQKLISLQKERFELEMKLQEANDLARDNIKKLEHQLMRQETETKICQTELDDAQEQLQLAQKRNSELKLDLQELEELRITAQCATQKAHDLELEANQTRDESIQVKVMAEKLSRFPELENKILFLTEENIRLKDMQENIHLIREEKESLKQKLERAEKRLLDFDKLQVNHENTLAKLNQLGSVASGSSSDVGKRLADLQREHVLLVEKQGQMQTEMHTAERQCQQFQSKIKSMEAAKEEDKKTFTRLADHVRRLQKKLILISKERDGYKSMLNSYESEVTIDVNAQFQKRVSELEEVIEAYRTQTTNLETEITNLTKQLTDTNFQYQRQSSSNKVENTISLEADQKMIIELREKIVELEDRLEQGHLQGDYDRKETKVLHFKMNPGHMRQKERSQEITKLREENEKMKALLNEQSNVSDLTLQIGSSVRDSGANSKQVEDLKTQLSSAELKNQRLMEAFKQKSHEFREVCYQLMGYKVDIPASNQYRLMSMYAESPTDYLIFQQAQRRELQLLETDFSSCLKDMIASTLQRQQSIPVFLSTLTLQLFNQQTMMDSTMMT